MLPSPPPPSRAVFKDMFKELGLQDPHNFFFKEMNSWMVGMEDSKETVRKLSRQWLEEKIRIFKVLPFVTLWMPAPQPKPLSLFPSIKRIWVLHVSAPAASECFRAQRGMCGAAATAPWPGGKRGCGRVAGKGWVFVLPLGGPDSEQSEPPSP